MLDFRIITLSVFNINLCRFLAVISLLFFLSAQATAETIQQQFIPDPVFHGKIRVLEAGKPYAPSIILVHGLNSSADVWRPFIPALSSKLHVVALDLPGFGESEKGNKLYSPDNYVAVIHHLTERLHINHFILVGHSLGGNVALRYAQTYPEQVRRLMLIDAAGILHRIVYSKFLAQSGIKILPEFYPQQRQDLESLAHNLFSTLADYSSAMDLAEHYVLSQPDLRRQFLDGAPPAIAAYAMALTNFSGVLDHFSIPTLLLWGAKDNVAPLRTAHMLASNFENAGLIVLPDSGHSPLSDQPNAVKNWLLKFTVTDTANMNRLLQAHRYRLTYHEPDTSSRVGRCQYQQHKMFTGDYARLSINHCHDVRLLNLRAQQISIDDSQVQLDNCRLHNKGTSLRVSHSSITMTACHIAGNPAIHIVSSKLDIAGCHLKSPYDSITADSTGTTSTLLFSISELDSQGQLRYEHGPVQLFPGQGM